VPTKDHIEWPYVVLLVGLVVMVAAALHLLSTLTLRFKSRFAKLQ
jgi:hypothetical protein